MKRFLAIACVATAFTLSANDDTVDQTWVVDRIFEDDDNLDLSLFVDTDNDTAPAEGFRDQSSEPSEQTPDALDAINRIKQRMVQRKLIPDAPVDSHVAEAQSAPQKQEPLPGVAIEPAGQTPPSTKLRPEPIVATDDRDDSTYAQKRGRQRNVTTDTSYDEICYVLYCPSCCWDCCNTFHFYADWLYWEPCANLSDVAIKTTRELIVTGTSSLGGGVNEDIVRKRKKVNIEGDYESGFRLGISMQPWCYCWSLAFNWTYFNPDETTSTRADHYLTLIPNPPCPRGISDEELGIVDPQLGEIFPVYDKVKGDWDLCLNVFDIEFRRPYVCDCFLFNPHVDLRILYAEEKNRVSFDGFLPQPALQSIQENSNGSALADIHGHVKCENCFTGVCPRVGINIQSEMFCGIGAYVNVAGSLLYGNHEAKSKTHITRYSSMDSSLNGDFIDHLDIADHYCTEFMTDLDVGIFWRCVFCRCFAVDFKLAWEHHYLFDGIHSHEEGVSVSTHGLSFGGGFAF